MPTYGGDFSVLRTPDSQLTGSQQAQHRLGIISGTEQELVKKNTFIFCR